MFKDIANVTIGEALIVTVFSMAIVFAALLAINFMLKGFKIFLSRDEKKKSDNSKTKLRTQKENIVINESIASNDDNQLNEEEIVAVITAALAASLSKPTSDIVIRKIRRVGENSSVWSRVGRLEQMN